MNVAPTLSLGAAAARSWDVVVVGAGPAGALAAREIARLGKSVLLVDRMAFPRWKVCGSCLNGRGLATLRSAGLGALVERLPGIPTSTLCLAADKSRAVVSLPSGIAISRNILDAELVREAVAAGAEFLPETHASLGDCGTGIRQVELRQSTEAHLAGGRVVLAASGLGKEFLGRTPGITSLVESASRIGAGVSLSDAPAWYAAGTIYMAAGRHGYVGLVRVAGGELTVAAALDVQYVRRCHAIGPAASEVLRSAGFPEVPGLDTAAWQGTPPLTRRTTPAGLERLFILGDASGYVEPFTGEGMAWALASGAAVAPLAARGAEEWRSDLVPAWTTLLQRQVASRQRTCRIVASVLRRPRLTRWSVRALGRAPLLARPILQFLNSGK